jgi:hypothetical protein
MPFLLLAICGLPVAQNALAQGGQADISGVVTDLSQATVPNAEVSLKNEDTGVVRTIAVQQSGDYRFAAVAPGRYSISVKAPSFAAESISGLAVELGMHLQENVTLRTGSEQQTVTVDGTVPIIDPADSDVGGVINQNQIDTLPISQRQYLNLATLLPGTSQDATRTFYNNVQSGGGGYFYANGFMLDGVTNTWAEQGEPRQNVPEGAVSEFKVYVSQFPAEFGLAMGGMTTVVTKSGTNQIHGEVFEYFRDEALNGDNIFQQEAEAEEGTGRPPFQRNQFGGDIGGPILKNRTHYYGAYERTQTSDSYTLFVAPSLSSFYAGNEGTFGKPSHDQMLTLRLDHQISNTQQLFVRYAQEWNELTREGCGGASTLYCYDGQIPRHSIVVGHTWEPRPAMVNEARFQYAYSSYQLGPYNGTIPTTPSQLVAPSFASQIGVGYVFPSFSYGKLYAQVGIEKHWEANESLSVQRGPHTYKAGGDLIYVPYVDSSSADTQGTYYFSQDQPFNPSDPSTIAGLSNPYLYTASIPPVITNLPSTQLGLFAQDDWKIRPNLTINYGLRYDREYGSSFDATLNPASFNPAIPFIGDPSKRGAKLNFGPRFGLTWDPFSKGLDVIRAGYGIYYNNIQTELNEGEKQNLEVCNITISNPAYLNPYGGQSATNFCSTAPPNVTVLSPDYRNAYSQQFTAGYSRQLGPNLALSVDGVYEHLLRDFRILDLNYPVNGVRPLPAWGQILQHASDGRAEYKALYVRLDRRLSKRYLYMLSYTLSSARDSNPQENVTDYSDYNLDYGPSNIDRRHSLVASGSVVLPWQFTLGAIWNVRSSLPFSAYSGTANEDGTSQYVPGTTRNQGDRGLSLTALNAYRAGLGLNSIAGNSIQSSAYDDFDIRISRPVFVHEQYKVEIIGQAFNLFGHTNLLGANMTTNAQSSTFGQITAASNAQQAELAARFAF